jgi:putative spermidine/putrescine transport system substrate-binding protein
MEDRMVRRRGAIGQGLAMLAALALPRGARAQARDLTVVSSGGAYQDAQREVFFRPWAAASGKRLLEETWHGGIAELRARAASGANTWDLVQVEAEELLIGCAEGLFEPLDIEAIGGAAHYIEDAVNPCGIGAITYAFVLAWDRARGGAAPRGWADLFDLRRHPGRRALRRGPKTTLEIALLADDVPIPALYRELGTEAGLARAFRRLDAIRDHIAWWERGSQPPQWLAQGEVALAIAYNGRIAAANVADGLDLGIVWNRALLALDFWVIMRGSPNREAALDFLRFAGQPAVQAKLPPLIPYGVTARGAVALIPREVAVQLPTAAQNAATALRINEAFWRDNTDRLTARFNAWLGA